MGLLVFLPFSSSLPPLPFILIPKIPLPFCFKLIKSTVTGDSHIFNLALEASWAAKYAGLSSAAAVDLVSRNIEEILDLGVKEEERDWVVYEGDPLQFGASVVLTVDGEEGRIVGCWPEST